ncbi:MAG: PTS IIA-like nitrogen regulatory protein PtsN [Alphaproteobacteria bacterium]|nr:PTS IIA-like nitrogen regulatory protein PtsN [Alphaproteobacteria bacterium]
MKIKDFLQTEDVFLDVSGSSKKQVLENISALCAKQIQLEEQVIFGALVERERLGTTGIGRGVAIPHARLANLKDLFGAFVRVKPIDFESVDGQPVDLLFVLLVPEDSGADHLKALARISKLLRDEAVCTQLRQAQTAEDVINLIKKADND